MPVPYRLQGHRTGHVYQVFAAWEERGMQLSAGPLGGVVSRGKGWGMRFRRVSPRFAKSGVIDSL